MMYRVVYKPHIANIYTSTKCKLVNGQKITGIPEAPPL